MAEWKHGWLGCRLSTREVHSATHCVRTQFATKGKGLCTTRAILSHRSKWPQHHSNSRGTRKKGASRATRSKAATGVAPGAAQQPRSSAPHPGSTDESATIFAACPSSCTDSAHDAEPACLNTTAAGAASPGTNRCGCSRQMGAVTASQSSSGRARRGRPRPAARPAQVPQDAARTRDQDVRARCRELTL